jgi:hypothetical protein
MIKKDVDLYPVLDQAEAYNYFKKKKKLKTKLLEEQNVKKILKQINQNKVQLLLRK